MGRSHYRYAQERQGPARGHEPATDAYPARLPEPARSRGGRQRTAGLLMAVSGAWDTRTHAPHAVLPPRLVAAPETLGAPLQEPARTPTHLRESAHSERGEPTLRARSTRPRLHQDHRGHL